MNNKDFFRLAKLLDMTYQDVATESGYSLATITAVSSGARKLSPRLEAFIKHKLIERRNDPIMQLIVETCGKEKE